MHSTHHQFRKQRLTACRTSFSWEIEDADDQFHRIVWCLLYRLRAYLVDEEVNPAGSPVHGVTVELAGIERVRVGGEFLHQGWISELVNATAQAHLDPVSSSLDAVTEDLDDADLAASVGLILKPHHPR